MSKKTNLDKIAAQDAYDYGFAQMCFGEGAGTQRKLVGATINYKMETIPEYQEKFDAAFAQLDQIALAEKALAWRKKLDNAAKAKKNFRAIKSGNLRGLSSGVYITVGVAYALHVTGYDKVLEAEGKKLYKKAKAEIKFRRMRAQGLNVEKLA